MVWWFANLEVWWFGLVGRRIWKRPFAKLKIETYVEMFGHLARSTPGGVGRLDICKLEIGRLNIGIWKFENAGVGNLEISGLTIG